MFFLIASPLLLAKNAVYHETCELSWTHLGEMSLDFDLDPLAQDILRDKGYMLLIAGETYQNEEDLSRFRPSVSSPGVLWAHKTGPNGGCWTREKMFFGEDYFCTYDLKLSLFQENGDTKELYRIKILNEKFDSRSEFEEELLKNLNRMPVCRLAP